MMLQSPYEVANQLRIERDIAINKLARSEREVIRLKAENQRLIDKCNRMVASAKIEDIQGVA